MADSGSRKSISSGLPVAKKPTGIPTPSGSGTTQSRLPTVLKKPTDAVQTAQVAQSTPPPPAQEELEKLQAAKATLPSTPIVAQTAQPAIDSNAKAEYEKKIAQMESTIKDLNEKLETLKLKRAEDRDKLREFDKVKIQMQQSQEFKTQAQDMISKLNKELQQSKEETKSIKEFFDAYKEEMSNHEQRLEEITVDKELAEVKVEELQDELNKANEKLEEVKLELDVLKGEIEISGTEGATATYQTKQMEKEAENLKAALLKLRDLSIQDKSEISTIKKLNEELQQKVKVFGKENETLKAERVGLLDQINELKDQINANLGSVQIIEQLTEKNLDLEEKVMEMKETIADLEAINEVNDQLQESAKEEEKELRQCLDLSENRIRECEKQIELLKYNIADHEKTIIKYREFTRQLQNDNDGLSRNLKSKMELEKTLSTASPAASYDFKQKFIESKNIAVIIENEVNKIELQTSKKYITYLLSYMSDFFLKKAGDNECIMALLFFKRLFSKSDLILNHLREKLNNLPTDKNEQYIGQIGFYNEVSFYLAFIKLLSNKYDYILNTCDPKTYLNIGMMYYDINSHEKVLDSIIDLLQRNQFDETFNLDGLEKMCSHLQTIYKNHLITDKFDEALFLNDLICFGNFSSELITVDLQRIQSLTEIKDDTSEIMILLKEISSKNEDLKGVLKKLTRNLPKEDKLNNRIVINFTNEQLADLENCLTNYHLLTKTLRELCNLISNAKMFLGNDGVEGFSAKKLESLAYQACDSTYIKDENGPYISLRNSIDLIVQNLNKAIACLEAGECEKELTQEQYKIRKYLIDSPVLKSAEQFKNIVIEAESIKHKLESKEDEIKELRKNLKTKSDDLSEQKLRISLVEKKGEDALKDLDEKNKKLTKSLEDMKAEHQKKEKDHNETIEALQQELDSLQNERRDLKEKLRFSTKKQLLDNLVNRQISSEAGSEPTLTKMSSSNNLLSSNPLEQELKLSKNVNKILVKNLNQLKQVLVKNLITNLTPLPQAASTVKRVEKANDQDDKSLNKLMTTSNGLMMDVYDSFINVKVENLKLRNTRKKLSDDKKAVITPKQIQDKILDLQSQIAKMKSLNSQTIKPKKTFIAEINLPVNNQESKVVDVYLNPREMQELFKHF